MLGFLLAQLHLWGLFASGFKRSIKIKDFADTIPGHGGVTDRMDCEMLNGAFVYIYLNQFVFYDGAKIMDNILKKIMKACACKSVGKNGYGPV